MGAEPARQDWMLNDQLEALLVGHGIAATQRDGVVHVGGDASRWARLTATKEATSLPVRLHVDAAGPAGAIVSDSLNGLGADPNAAVRDALQHFCLGDFHVLLAGLWRLLEEDQVEHRVAATAQGRWDVYFG